VTTATAGHISLHLREVLEGIGAENLGQIVAAMRARDLVPGSLAFELANELAAILSSDPLETDEGLIFNHPTCGWYRRKAQRIAEARS
jgi:hypothetical protein